jgi:hypothetical protein
MEEPRPEDNMTVEEAQQIIQEEQAHPTILMTDDVYPWWSKLKTPLMIISFVIGALCVAILFMATSLRNLSEARAEEFEKDACYDLFTNASSEATSRVRASASRVDGTGWKALVGYAVTGNIDEELIGRLNVLVKNLDETLEDDVARLQARSDWVHAGSPLPCPIKNSAEIED